MQTLVASESLKRKKHSSIFSFPHISRLAVQYRSIAWMLCSLFVFSLVDFSLETNSATADAQEKNTKLAPVKELSSFTTKYCISCHDKKTLKGGFDMETLLADQTVDKNPSAWQSVLERIVARDMPPKSRKERPSEDEYRKSEDWLREQLQANEAFAATQRPRPMRRLNCDEYNHTIQQIFGLPGYKPADTFPPDDAVEGFTNIGEGLNLSSVLIERYLIAARDIADRVLVEGPQPTSRKLLFTHNYDQNKSTDGSKGDGAIRGFDPPGAVLQLPNLPARWVGDHFNVVFNATARGSYTVRLKATPRNVTVRPKYLPHFLYQLNNEQVFEDDAVIQDGVPMLQDFVVTIDKGQNKIDFRWTNGFPHNNNLRAQQYRLPNWNDNEYFPRSAPWNYQEMIWKPAVAKDPKTPYPFPYFENFSLEVEGPLYPDGWPASRFQRENAKAIAARDTLHIGKWLLPKLYRRPAKEQEVAGFVAFVERSEKALAEIKQPQSLPPDRRYIEALRMGVQRELVSPQFLFMVEPGPIGRPLTDHELAVRLSYFLWSAPPDDELIKLANEGKLRPALAAQTKRMLADPRSNAFLDRFTTEWLGLAKLATSMPEPTIFKRFDEQLRVVMFAEPRAQLGYLLNENQSLYDLLDARYAFLNDQLADLYHLPSLWAMFPITRSGFEPISGGNMRKVMLPDGQRGGLVTQAAFLALTSENTRTSPVRRGVWILEKIFNRTPPLPPPNVSGIIPDASKGGSAVERLKLHRDLPNCAGCHQKIDPLGLALENFDVIGEWRDREPMWTDPANPGASAEALRKKLKLRAYDQLPTFPIDSSFSMGEVHGRGVEALKKYLVANKDRFARGFTEKITTYALGRKLLLTDEPELATIRNTAVKDDFRFQTLILALVQNSMFQSH